MGTNTTNYGFMKPTIGADSDVWGADFTATDTPLTDPSPGLNGNWEKLDQVLKDIVTTLNAVSTAAYIPIGSLYMSSSDDDPATTLGYGTWAAYAEGRAIVGAGTAGGKAWGVGDTDGAIETTLKASDLPSHTHTVPEQTVTTTEDGAHTHDIQDLIIGTTDTSRVAGRTDGGTGNRSTPTLTSAGDHTHDITLPEHDTEGLDDSSQTSVEVIQPSIAVYVWVRTA